MSYSVHCRTFAEFIAGKTDLLRIFEDATSTTPVIGEMHAALFYVPMGAEEPDYDGDDITFECEAFERKEHGAFLIKVKPGSLRLNGDPREYRLSTDEYNPFESDTPTKHKPHVSNVSSWAADFGYGFHCTIDGELWANGCHTGWQKVSLPEEVLA